MGAQCESRIRRLVSSLIARQLVEDDDVAALRECLSAGGLSWAEAADLVRLERHVRAMSDQWLAFFIDQMVGFFVWERRPTGQLSDGDIEWLAFRLGLDSTGPTPATRALLTVLSEEGATMPETLSIRLNQLSAARAERLGHLVAGHGLPVSPPLG